MPPPRLTVLAAEIEACCACPRLVAWREAVARRRRRAFSGQAYWGRPVPGFGDGRAQLLILGLAPGAHGANRTGRVFTGDASGDFLYAALHRAGLASQAEATGRDDGLTLRGVFVSNAARCAPPDNAPSPGELRRCAPFLARELALIRPRAILALGAIAWRAALDALAGAGHARPRPRPGFTHGAELVLPGAPALVGSYHVSQQNTRTGRLTAPAFDATLARAAALAGLR